jgi:hypothetical protein
MALYGGFGLLPATSDSTRVRTCALWPLALSQSYARASAVLVDELDPGLFKSTPDYLER